MRRKMKKSSKKIKFKIISVFVAFFFALSMTSGCGNKKSDEVKTMRIGVVKYSQNDVFINAVSDCIKKNLDQKKTDKMNTIMTVRSGDNDQAQQNEEVEEMIDAGCDILCIDLVDRTAPTKIIDMAKKNNIPVIFFNREPVKEDLMRWEKLYYVGADAEESGVMQGELAADAIKKNSKVDRNKDGKIQYVVLEGQTGHQDTIIRTDKAVSTISQSGIAMDKVSYEIADWNRAQAENHISQLIEKNNSSIELILANNDEMALGAIDAYEKANVTESSRPLIFGIDGLDDGLNAVKNGEMSGTVYNDKEGQAKAIADLAVALFNRQNLSQFKFTNDKYLILPYKKIDKKNVDQFISDD